MSLNQLYLQADNIQLQLLELQRCPTSDHGRLEHQSRQVSHSLEQFKTQLKFLEDSEPVAKNGNSIRTSAVSTLSLASLQKQLASFESQFGNVVSGFEATKANSAAPVRPFVDYTDDESPKSNSSLGNADRDELNSPYRDNPSPCSESIQAPGMYEGRDVYSNMDNHELHNFNSEIIREQDEHLDALAASIARQHDMGLRLEEELDGQARLLEHMDIAVDHHGTNISRAKRSIVSLGKTTKYHPWLIILFLFLILLLLIAVTK